MPIVELYTTETCPYCIRARKLLEKKGVQYTEYRVDLKPELRPEMEARASGCTSVPQIFVDEQHIGGCDDMYELDFDGRLDAMLGIG